MTHREKVRRLIRELGERGVGAWTVAPPAYRLAWLFGLKVPPPHMQDSRSLAIFLGLFFGVAFVFVSWDFSRDLSKESFLYSVGAGVFAGPLFGIYMSRHFKKSAEGLDLPAWENYPNSDG